MRCMYHFDIGSNFPVLLASLLVIVTITLSSHSKVYASNSVDFYSLNSPPPGIKSLETLIGNWWNWWEDHPTNMASNWPECFTGDGGVIDNHALVFTPNPAWAVESNPNATNQKCQISSHQLLYFTVYPGECSTIFGSNPPAGEFPDIKSVDGLLKCAQDVNKVIKKMQVKVDSQDVSSHIIRQTISQPFNFVIKPENADDWDAPIVGGNNTSMAENYYLFFKPLPVGDHQIELEVIRQPLQANQPVEHDVAKWDIKVVP